MTNVQLFEDLKQYIDGRISQSEALLRSELASKEDLKGYATKEDLKDFATREDLKGFATKEDLKAFATKEDFNELKLDLKATERRLIKRMDEGFANVGDAIDALSEDIDQRFTAIHKLA